uniref:Uncharacterized protein n=1 Tax=Arcella intermedia TaxID=1963864 RepID=A0A6B2L6K1_9EUKA
MAFQNSLEQLQFAKASKILRCSLKEELRGSISFLFAPLLMLTACESVYYSLSFMEFSQERENYLQILYSQVVSDLNQVTAVLDTVITNEPNQESPEVIQAKFLSHLLKHLRQIIVTRKKMIGVYLDLMNRKDTIDYGQLVENLTGIKNQVEKEVDHYLMAQLRDNIICEIDLLSKLFLTQKNISLFKFKDSLFLIYQCKCEIEALDHKLQSVDESLADPLEYSVFRFFKTFLASLTAKACFYFRSGLFNQEDNFLTIRPELDYHKQVMAFVEKTKCFNVSVVVHMSQKAAIGTLSWPRVYSFPEDSQPDQHWPNVISLIQENKKYLSNFGNSPYYIFDPKVNSSYFIAKVDKTVFLLAIFNGMIPEQEADVASFFNSIAFGLRNWNLLELNKQ